MHKKLAILLAVLMTLSGPVVRAEDTTSLLLTDEQIGLIRSNCLRVQSNLQRIHSNDALARYNLAQQYNIISTKLMAPMNSRVALSKLDGVALLQTTVDYNRQYSQFDSMYQQYETTMQRALKMNCKDQPVAFFDTIALAREHRASVRTTLDKINGLLATYRGQVDEIRKTIVIPGVNKETSR